MYLFQMISIADKEMHQLESGFTMKYKNTLTLQVSNQVNQIEFKFTMPSSVSLWGYSMEDMSMIGYKLT